MAKTPEKCVKLKLTFPERVIGEPVIHKLSNDLKVVPNILRGRITEKNAWLEVELVGAQKNLDRALQYLHERNVQIEEKP